MDIVMLFPTFYFQRTKLTLIYFEQIVFPDDTPSNGKATTGKSAVTGIGRASVSHNIAMTSRPYAHFDSYKWKTMLSVITCLIVLQI